MSLRFFVTAVMVFAGGLIFYLMFTLDEPPADQKPIDVKPAIAEASVPIQAEFVQYTATYKERYKRYEVLGYVRNQGTLAISRAKLHMLVLQDNGQLLTRKSAYTFDKIIAPGKKSLVRMSVFKLSKPYRFRFEVEGRTTTKLAFKPAMWLKDVKTRPIRIGFEVTGRAENPNQYPLERVSVFVAFLNKENQVYYIGRRHIGGLPILEHEDFKVWLPTKKKPFSYDVIYQARRGKLPQI